MAVKSGNLTIRISDIIIFIPLIVIFLGFGDGTNKEIIITSSIFALIFLFTFKKLVITNTYRYLSLFLSLIFLLLPIIISYKFNLAYRILHIIGIIWLVLFSLLTVSTFSILFIYFYYRRKNIDNNLKEEAKKALSEEDDNNQEDTDILNKNLNKLNELNEIIDKSQEQINLLGHKMNEKIKEINLIEIYSDFKKLINDKKEEFQKLSEAHEILKKQHKIVTKFNQEDIKSLFEMARGSKWNRIGQLILSFLLGFSIELIARILLN